MIRMPRECWSEQFFDYARATGRASNDIEAFEAATVEALQSWMEEDAFLTRTEDLAKHEYQQAKRAAMLRDSGYCLLCRRTASQVGGLDAHHIVPPKNGGEPADPQNLASLCRGCHNHIQPVWQRYAEILKRKVADAQIPA